MIFLLLSPPPEATSDLFCPDRYPAARARPWPLVEVTVPRALRMRPTAPTRSSRRETDRGLLPLQPIAPPLPLSSPPAASQTWSCCRRRSQCTSSFVCSLTAIPSRVSSRLLMVLPSAWPMLPLPQPSARPRLLLPPPSAVSAARSTSYSILALAHSVAVERDVVCPVRLASKA